MVYLHLLFAFLVFAAASITAVALLVKNHSKSKILTPFNVFMIGCFIAVYLLLTPVIMLEIQEKEILDESVFTRFVLSLHQTFQVFTINIDSKAILEEAYSIGKPYYLILSTLMVFCPVLTFTFLLSFFDRFKNWFTLLIHPFKSKFVFSELNDATYSVAESIFEKAKKDKAEKGKKREDRLKKPLVIFTDAYSDISDEPRSELIEKAKRLGALCIKDDILTIQRIEKLQLLKILLERTPLIRVLKETKVYLMLADYDDYSNVQALCALSEDENLKSAKKAFGKKINVHVFFGNNSYDYAYKNAQKLVAAKCEKLKFKEIVIVRNNWKQDVIYQLLQKVPLFEGILDKTTETDSVKLRVSIIGAGNFGTEMFLNSYWCGQMSGVDLRLNVFSLLEGKDEFINRINRINPEIFESAKEGSNILRISGEGENAFYANPYFRFGYCQGDVFMCKLSEIAFDNGENLLDSDYIFVSLGKDASNIDFAQSIQRELCIKELPGESGEKKNVRKPIIVCVVNNEDVYKSLENDTNSIIHYLGVTEYAYSCETIFKDKEKKLGKVYNETYQSIKDEEPIKTEDPKKFEYNLSSDIAKAIHLKYRAYSLMKIKNMFYLTFFYILIIIFISFTSERIITIFFIIIIIYFIFIVIIFFIFFFIFFFISFFSPFFSLSFSLFFSSKS